jgi:hypothetical protein
VRKSGMASPRETWPTLKTMSGYLLLAVQPAANLATSPTVCENIGQEQRPVPRGTDSLLTGSSLSGEGYVLRK